MELFRTAINQAPYGGNDYPFVDRQDVARMLPDLYLSYEDADFVLPFRLALFSTELTNDYDLLIVDADDAVVFDSEAATDFAVTLWGTRRAVVEWRSATAVCRVVVDLVALEEFAATTEPEDAVLDARTANRLARRVRSLTVNGVPMLGDVRLEGGFNVATALREVSPTDGGRFKQRFVLSAVPGSGLGQRPGCEDPLPVVRSINGQKADAGGNFFLDLDPCLRGQLPITVDGDDVSYGNDDLTADEAKSAILIDDDCGPCCPCDFYVRTYAGLQRMYDRWLAATQELESIRDKYHANRARWLEQRACRIANALKVVMRPEAGCTVAFGVGYCNLSHGCVAPVELRLNLTLYEDGVEVSPPSDAFACQQAFIEGSGMLGEEPYALGGEWPTFTASLPFLDQQHNMTLRFRLCLRECTSAMSVKATVTAHSPDPDPAYGGDDIEIPYLDDGSAYGSAYPTRALVELVRPVLGGTPDEACECVPGSGGGGGDGVTLTWTETPDGVVDGVNATFTLALAPTDGNLLLFRNGVLQTAGVDFTLSSATITFLTGAIPLTGDVISATYQYS